MNKVILSLTAISLGVGLFLTATNNVFAYGPNYSQDRHEKMIQAFEKNDYNAWKNLMQGRGRVLEFVNKDNFSKFNKMHKLMLDGKSQDANVIRAELGLGQGRGYGRNR